MAGITAAVARRKLGTAGLDRYLILQSHDRSSSSGTREPCRVSSYSNLDILRAIAVGAVFVGHAALTAKLPGILTYAPTLGRLGVVLFFVHTSVVLLMSLSRDRALGAVVRFYIRRAFRIYPLAITAVLATLLFQIPEKPWDSVAWKPIGAKQLISNVLLIQNVTRVPSVLTQLWSLPLEIDMYLVLPVLFFALAKKSWHLFIILSWIGAVSTAILVYLATGHMSILAFVPCFLAGSLAFKLRNMRRTLGAWVWPVSLLTALSVGAYVNDGMTQVYVEWVLCLFIALLWPRIRDAENSMITGAAASIAKYSYGIYLSHIPCLWVCFYRLPLRSVTVKILGAALLTGLSSVFCYHVVEQPGISLGKRLAALHSGQ